MRARKCFTFLHSTPAISVIFVCNLFVQLFSRYNMTFNREILGGGMIIQAIPPPKNMGGGIYPPIPPPRIDTHDVCTCVLRPGYNVSEALARAYKLHVHDLCRYIWGACPPPPPMPKRWLRYCWLPSAFAT